MRVLAIADEVVDALWGGALDDLRPDLILACGDLPFEYLENLVSRTDRPLLYVPGNHDPDLRGEAAFHEVPAIAAPPGPAGCINVDGRVEEAAGLRVAGLGGSVRYRPGPNQYTQRQMERRALALEIRVRLARKPIDILITHSPPAGHGDSEDPPHRGFVAVERLVRRMSPRYLIHGHVNQYGPRRPSPRIGRTVIVNAIPSKLIEIE
ncbi:MAG TPA: metallophosphoesterase [Gaiellales bacterium]|nr:metallophosphoesterase [Gaiellales bacterium]